MNVGALRFDLRRVPGLIGADIAAMPRSLKATLLGCLALMGVGGVAALIALPPGWEVMGTTPTVEWGLLIIGYAAFAVTTSGLCLTSALGTVFGIDRFRPLERRHAILAILCLCTAFGIIALDLHWPIRMVFGVVLSPAPSSPMWWMGVAYGGYLMILIVEIWSMFAHRPMLHQIFCTAAAIMAIIAPSTLGAVFGYLPNRPLWHGPISSLYMLATAVLAGSALLALVFALVERRGLRGAESAAKAISGVRIVLFVALLVSVGFVVRELVSGFTSREPGMAQAIDALVSGPLAIPFWGGRVGIGFVVPILILVVPLFRSSWWLLLAAVTTLVGVFLDRTAFVLGGLLAPTSSSTGGVVSTPYAHYSPSLVELGIIAGAVALVAFVYIVIERYVDLGYYDIHTGFSFSWLRRRIARPGPLPTSTAATASAASAAVDVPPGEIA